MSYCPGELPVPGMGSTRVTHEGVEEGCALHSSQDPVRQSRECLIFQCIIAYQTCAYMYVCEPEMDKRRWSHEYICFNIFIKASGRWWEEEAEFTQVLFWDRSHSPCKLATAWPRSLSNSERTISESRGGASHCVGLCQAKQ